MKDSEKHQRPSFFLSIRWKLFLVFFTLISVIFLALAYFSTIAVTDEFRFQIEENLNDHARDEINEINNWFSKRKNDFLNYSNLLADSAELTFDPADYHSPEFRQALRAQFDSFLFHYPEFLELFLADPATGEIVAASRSAREGGDVSREPFFVQGKDGFFMTKIYPDMSLGRYVVCFAAPVRQLRTGQQVVLAGTINAFALNDLFGDLDAGSAHERYTLVAEDSVPFAGFPDFKAAVPLQSVGLERALGGQSGHGMYFDHEGEEVIGHYNYLPEYGIALLIEQPTHEAFAPLRAVAAKLGILMVLFLVISVLVIFWFSNRITTPLRQLTRFARAGFKGRVIRSGIKTGDEIGILSKALERMTEDLSEAAEEKSRILETLPYPIYILDKTGCIDMVNRMTESMAGLPRKRLIGEPFLDMISPMPEGPDSPPVTEVQDLFREKDSFETNAFCASKSRHRIPISLSGAVIRSNGRVARYVMVAKDLRELKRYAKKRVDELTPVLHGISIGDFSRRLELPKANDEFTDLVVSIDLMARNLQALMEEDHHKTEQLEVTAQRLRAAHSDLLKVKQTVDKEKARIEALLSGLGEGILAVDPQGAVVLMNPAAERIFGKAFSKAEGRPWHELFAFEDEEGQPFQPDSKLFSQVIRKKKTVYIILYFIAPDGRRIPLATTVSPILFNNRLIGIVSAFRDITKEMEVDKAKSEFVSLASHQLRTPLTGIKWLVQAVLKRGDLNKWQVEFLEDAIKSNDRMIILVNDLLNISRLEAGVVPVDPKEVDLAAFLKSIIKEAKPEAGLRGLNIDFPSPPKNLTVMLDPELVRQVVTNLLSNAVKYSEPGKVVTVSAKKKKDLFEISVRDQGIGISKEDQKSLFDKFFRSDAATRMETRGSGLGLYIVSKVLRSCHGTITCESALGKGTVFTVTLPVKGPARRGGEKSLITHKMS